MKRRKFLTTSLAAAGIAGLAPGLSPAVQAAAGKSPREYYELRLYHLRKGAKQAALDEYFEKAVLPGLKRLGIGPVGVFNLLIGPDNPTTYVLIPHPSLESVTTMSSRLAADPEFLKNAAAFANAPATDPFYQRVESSLLQAIEGVPNLVVPAATKTNGPRIFELRTYESHSGKAALLKIEMFNRGELAIFRRTGLEPVFFGEALIGGRLPNLTYMLTFENLAAREANWNTFIKDPEWKKLSTTPGFTDAEIVSNISNVILRPTAYSQI
jgi:hypothetical protein